MSSLPMSRRYSYNTVTEKGEVHSAKCFPKRNSCNVNGNTGKTTRFGESFGRGIPELKATSKMTERSKPDGELCPTPDEKASNPAVLRRRSTELRLPEVKAASIRHAKGLQRRFSMLSIPKDIHLRYDTGLSNTVLTTRRDVGQPLPGCSALQPKGSIQKPSIESSCSDKDQPSLKSASPEPERQKVCMIGEHGHVAASAVAKFMNMTSYQPKYCWCLRCQMMFKMFKTHDQRLDDWGNYPCFTRNNLPQNK